MDSELELGLAPPAAKHRPPPPTTITDLGNDLLREIFLLLPSLPSLVRAALACPTFLHAVRSCPAFRRRFQARHPPQLLGFFIDPCHNEIPTFTPFRSRSDPDLAAAVRGGDFFLTRLPEDSCNPSLGWEIARCHSGYLVLVNHTTNQIAAYNPLTHALDLFPEPPGQVCSYNPETEEFFFDLHIIVWEEDHGLFRIVSVRHRNKQRQIQACIAVFSSATREWKVLPWVDTPTPLQPEGQLEDDEQGMLFYSGVQSNGSIYWMHRSETYVLVLNNTTFQFSRVDLPLFFGEASLGHTKDGKLCMVNIDDPFAAIGMLIVRCLTAGDDGVEKWMRQDTYPLDTFVDTTKCTLKVERVIDGFVYLSSNYDVNDEYRMHKSLLSLCLETGKLSKLFDDSYATPADPYIMAWPPSLICNKKDSETKVTVDRVADDGRVGTEKSPSVLVAALKSYKEALINADEAKVAEIEAFFTSHLR